MSGRNRSVLSALMLIGLAYVAPVRAASPLVALTLTASPKVAAELTPVTFHATATVSGGPLTNVWISLDHRLDSCEPVAVCSIDAGHTVWKFSELGNGTTDLYASADGFTTTNTYRIDVTACTPDCAGTQGAVQIGAPTLTASLSRSPTGQIMPGDTLHFTVSGATNVGPVDADLQTTIVAGLSEPTVMPPGGAWNPTQQYLDYDTRLDLKSTYSFDAVVTGAIGESVQLIVYIYPTHARDGAQYSGGFAKKTYTFAIGPTPTKTPSPTKTPLPTKAPPASTRAGSSPSQTAAASPTASAASLATPTSSAAEARASSEPSESAPPVTSAAPATPDTQQGASGAESTAAASGPAAIAIVGLLLLAGLAAVALPWATRSPRRAKSTRPGMDG